MIAIIDCKALLLGLFLKTLTWNLIFKFHFLKNFFFKMACVVKATDAKPDNLSLTSGVQMEVFSDLYS